MLPIWRKTGAIEARKTYDDTSRVILSVEAEGALFAVYLLGGGGWFEGMEGWLEVRAGHVYEV